MGRPGTLLAVILLLLFPRLAMAQTISLDGAWQFAADTNGRFTPLSAARAGAWRDAVVPISWQAQFPDLRDYQGVAWYRRTFSVPAVGKQETVVLRFGAVDYRADVYVNGTKVGSHEGGYTPFELEIRHAVVIGENELLVRVMDPVTGEAGTEGIRYGEIPHGKQSWYVQTSGIWQSAHAAVVPARRILRMHLTPSLDGSVRVTAWLAPGPRRGHPLPLRLALFGPNGSQVATGRRTAAPEDTVITLTMRVASPTRWEPNAPTLYRAELTLGGNAPFVERFGFRAIEAREGRLFLNGEPLYVRAALDQDFYPTTIYTPPSGELIRDEMRKARQLGLNMLRCHIKVPDPRYLDMADEAGLLIWYEIPNWDRFSSASVRLGQETFGAMLDRDWNHPSLVIIGLINESWGIDLQKAEQRAWLRSAFDSAKQAAPGRLIVDNSACWGNFHIRTDVNDYHTYWAIPENRRRFDSTVAEVSRRPSWLFSPFGDGMETGKEPLLISEFGNWGLPTLPPELPWWIDRRFGSVDFVVPAGFDRRFQEHGYASTFGSYNRLAEECQWAQYDALRYEIESLRSSPQIQGYVITEFTDVNWEANGLLDMWRNLKAYGNDLASLQQPDVLIPRFEATSVWSGEPVRCRVLLSHYGPAPLETGRVVWSASTGQTGAFAVPAIARGDVGHVGTFTLSAPDTRQQQRLRVWLVLKMPDGSTAAAGSAEVTVVPRPHPGPPGAAATYDRSGSLGRLLPVRQVAEPGAVHQGRVEGTVITAGIDEPVLQFLRAGGRVLCLADSLTALPAGMPFRLVDRSTEGYDGNWVGVFNWMRAERSPFRGLGCRPRMGFEAAEVMPSKVITGIPPESFQDVLAGMFAGWLHLNSGYIVQMRVGQGRLLLCTLRVAQAYGHDPFAASLLHGLLDYMESAEFQPRLEWTP